MIDFRKSKSSDFLTKVGSLVEVAATTGLTVNVLLFPLQISENDNPKLAPLIEQLRNIRFKGTVTVMLNSLFKITLTVVQPLQL